MADTIPPDGTQVAAAHLRRLLTSVSDYRRQWMRYTRRMRTSEINYAAVSQVVALYLWDRGVREESERDLPRKLRDRIRQALRGELLSHETLTWLIEAFGMDESDTHAVWDAFAGGSMVDLSGEGIAFTLSALPVPIITPQRHQTSALFSRYYIGADQTLNRIETSHIIVALEDGVDTFAYSPRNTVTDVTVITGGDFVGFHESTPGFVGVEIRLDRPLLSGQHASLQYFTAHRPTLEPCTELRRAARRRIDNVDMRVIFEDVCPARAWWCAWDAYDGGNPVHRTPVEVSDQLELHQFVPYIEQTVVGFRWEW
jgi:hypothetical protein